MIKLKSLLENITEKYEFAGFHRQRRKRNSYDDLFITGNSYGSTYFAFILDAIYSNDRDEALHLGYLDYEWNEYDENYDQMESDVAKWLNDKGYRWIFVTVNRPHGIVAYGKHIYKIYFKKEDILYIFNDPLGADDVAYAYVYHIKNPPKVEEYLDLDF